MGFIMAVLSKSSPEECNFKYNYCPQSIAETRRRVNENAIENSMHVYWQFDK